MKSVKITVRFKSPVASELQSDTIFGQFAWWYRYKYGEDKLKEALEGFETKPFIVFSDGFLEDTVAMPILKPQSLEQVKDILGDSYYEEIKRIKSARYLRVNDKWIMSENVNLSHIKDYIENQAAAAEKEFVRNSINRITNTVDEGLYSTKEKFFTRNINIYAKYDDDIISKEEIAGVFGEIGSFGFGKDKSTGKGRFDLVDIKDSPSILQSKKTKTFISLSSGVSDEYCEILFGKTFTKFGKHSEELVFKNPFKNPVVLFQSGSVFRVKEQKDIYGRGFQLSNFEGHYHNAFMIPLFVDMEE